MGLVLAVSDHMYETHLELQPQLLKLFGLCQADIRLNIFLKQLLALKMHVLYILLQRLHQLFKVQQGLLMVQLSMGDVLRCCTRTSG